MAGKRKRMQILVTVSVPLKTEDGTSLTRAQWRREIKTLINEGTGFFASGGEARAISVKPYADPKVYPKERSAASRNREWLTKTVEALE